MSKFGSLLLCFVLFAGVKLSAQITITDSDIQNFLALHNTIELNIDSTTTSHDIGTTGETSWDFSDLSSDFQSTYESVDPSGTPFASRFPAATACFYGRTAIMGYNPESWQYLGLDNGLMVYGSAAQQTISLFTLNAISANNPADIEIITPLNYNSSWTEDFVEKDSVSLAPLYTQIDVYSVHEENLVDAYGTITLPGGVTTQALRIRTDRTETTDTSYYRYISYLFLTKTGTQISIEAADTLSPNTGTINVTGITYLNSSVTGVKQINNNLPENFTLEQNYPNPFNPTTRINYSIPSSQKVVLKVYDALGRDVTTLVNHQQAAGNYTVDFDASGFASGIYFYRLQAGTFVQMKKMILMK